MPGRGERECEFQHAVRATVRRLRLQSRDKKEGTAASLPIVRECRARQLYLILVCNQRELDKQLVGAPVAVDKCQSERLAALRTLTVSHAAGRRSTDKRWRYCCRCAASGLHSLDFAVPFHSIWDRCRGWGHRPLPSSANQTELIPAIGQHAPRHLRRAD